jgi:hypothetical protein
MERVVECVSASTIVLKRFAKGRAAQQFFFDPVTKTIKNNYWKGYSLNQNGQDLKVLGTNARWY